MKIQRESIDFDAKQSFKILRWNNNVRDVETLINSGETRKLTGTGDRWHYHPEIELTVISEGRGTRFMGDHIGSFDGLDVALIGANVPHYWKTLGSSKGYALQWRLEKTHPLAMLPESTDLRKLWQQAAYGLRYTGSTARIILQAVIDVADKTGLARLGAFLQLLHILLSAPKRDKQPLSKQAFDLASLHTHQPAIEKIIRHVLKNYRDDIHPDHALKLAGMSRATFARQFPKYVGKTFSAFVTQVRLNGACRDLVSTQDNISQIAFANGFNNLSTFNRLFLETYQCSPKEYRRKGDSRAVKLH